ncbi:MAG: transporter [Paludibacteraceae bacterium]
MFQKIKPYMMPVAITFGGLFHSFVRQFDFIIPYLIFTMLFLTFTNIEWKNMRFTKLHLWLVIIQLAGSIVVYSLIAPFNKVLAQGSLICILAPTATAAPVITGMLKGSVESLTSYSLLSNVSVALFAPLIFYFTGDIATHSFGAGVLSISKSVLLVILTPLLAVFLLRTISRKITETISKFAMLSFFIWTVSLTIVTGKTVAFIIVQNKGHYFLEISLAVEAMVVCIVLFASGKLLGKRYNDKIAGGQGLGQKNTVLAIWMAQTYLNPLASIAPGIYILWQNLFNSWQIWRQEHVRN